MKNQNSENHKNKTVQDKKRLFIALNLPEIIKQDIPGLIESLKAENSGVKWIRPEGAHITLAFLGSINKKIESIIMDALARLENKFGALKFKLDILSAFPSIDRPRVIYLNCLETGNKAAPALQKTIKNEIEIRTDLKLDRRPWKAHITLGRARGRGEAINLNYKIEQKQFEIITFDLMSSELKPAGAQYTLVRSYKL